MSGGASYNTRANASRVTITTFIVCLDSEVGQRALADAALSRDCVRHARMFFDRPDFDLASAVPGTFAFSPSAAMSEALKRDYDRMAGMIMGEAPEFDEVIARIQEFERRINAPA